jgi:phage shock protein E
MNLKQTKIVFLVIASIAFISCAQNTKKTTEKAEQIVSYISPAELQERIDTIQLIDVRTPEEYNSGHLKNAVNINYLESDFLKKMNTLDKSKEIYIYCKSGNRSGNAAQKLKDAGFPKVYDLKGGILNWNQNNLEIVK